MAAPHVTTSRRILPALLISLLFHGLLLWGGRLLVPPPPPPPLVLDVTLVVPAAREALLKNTLDESAREMEPPSPPPTTPGSAPRPSAKPRPAGVAAAQRKLADHLYYPPQAVAAGLQGDVQLLLTLDATGTILEAEVAVSSGHPILDQAAMRAAYAMGRVDGAVRREMLLPVSFRLR